MIFFFNGLLGLTDCGRRSDRHEQSRKIGQAQTVTGRKALGAQQWAKQGPCSQGNLLPPRPQPITGHEVQTPDLSHRWLCGWDPPLAFPPLAPR